VQRLMRKGLTGPTRRVFYFIDAVLFGVEIQQVFDSAEEGRILWQACYLVTNHYSLLTGRDTESAAGHL
jgi:hypothetical protein